MAVENANLRLRMDRKNLISWRNFFLLADRAFHIVEAVYIRPLRKLALRKAEKWMLERLEMSDGLGAIYPAMLNAIVALRSSATPMTIRRSSAPATSLKSWALKTPASRLLRAHFPHAALHVPVWDTAYAVFALGEAGIPASDPRLLKAADWMLAKEVRHKGDWAVKVRKRRARRLVLRIQQRVLPRHRRHRPGAAGSQSRRQPARALPA